MSRNTIRNTGRNRQTRGMMSVGGALVRENAYRKVEREFGMKYCGRHAAVYKAHSRHRTGRRS